jgi:hypothetical protein
MVPGLVTSRYNDPLATLGAASSGAASDVAGDLDGFFTGRPRRRELRALEWARDLQKETTVDKATRDGDHRARSTSVRPARRNPGRRRTIGLVAIVAGLVLAVAASSAWVLSERTSQVSLSAATTFTGLSRDHVQGPVIYDQVPPVGGEHAPVWQNCGLYAEPISSENAVHSMEHGAIWVTYRPDLPAEQVSLLRDALRDQPYGLLSPYAGLPSPVVATVWGTQLQLPSARDPRLKVFISRYADASRAPEPRAACTGGFGTPDS